MHVCALDIFKRELHSLWKNLRAHSIFVGLRCPVLFQSMAKVEHKQHFPITTGLQEYDICKI